MKMFRKCLEKFGRCSKEFEKSLKTDVEDRITDEIWAIHLNLMEKFNSTQPKDEMITPTEEKPLKESSGAKELREQLEFAAQLNKGFKKSSTISVEDAYLENLNKVWEACNQPKQEGTKLDQGKLSYTLLPFKAITEVVKVLEFGKQKYAKDNWQKVPNGKERYIDAALRHIISYIGGETTDPESGLHHLAHATCCLLFAIWFDLVGKEWEV